MPTPSARPSALAGTPPRSAVESATWPRLSLDLATVTPVVGGGVEPFEPDEVEPVRVPGIRGQLREWWRRLYAREGESAEDLFAREAALWGGVGVAETEPRAAGARAVEGPGLRSRVVVWVDPAAGHPGTSAAAGFHPPDDRGLAKAMPDWEGGREFGYALFPLQLPEGERRGKRGPLPTRRVRKGLSFRLVVELRLGAPRACDEEPRDALRQVLASLWAWVHLGGVGARTRRGFGALELTASARLDGFRGGLDELAREWHGLLTPAGDEGFGTLLERFHRAACANAARWPSIVLAGSDGTALAAHRDLLGCLRDFRQQPGFARDPGNRPGRSRWPEPNLLRLLRDAGADWEHAIPEEVKARADALGAPRAAFGLPIVMHFKTDRGRLRPGQRSDEFASGQILPPEQERWASPLLLRPVRWRRENYRPLVIVLGSPSRVPAAVHIRFEREPEREVAVERSAGARGEIHDLLTQHGGRALEAFVSWLVAQRHYGRVP